MFEFLRQFSRDRFAKKVMRAIRAAGGPGDFVYDREAFTLKSGETVMFLGNTHLACRQATGARRQQIFGNFIAAFTQQGGLMGDTTEASFEEIESQLVAVVRERAFLAAMDGPGWGLDRPGKPEARSASEPVSRWFARSLVIDFPTHVLVVNQAHLKRWGRTFDEVFAIGLEALRRSKLAKFRQENGYYVGEWNDDYDSSRILLPDIFNDLPLDGAPVAVLPNRLTLMVAGEHSATAIAAMLAKAEQIVREVAKPQNPAPLVLRDGAFVDFEVPATSPIFNEVQRARKFAALGTYQEQKANLERYYKKAGKDYFVASFILHQKDSGEYRSSCSWTAGIPSLLPETDEVLLVRVHGPEDSTLVARAPWSRVVAVVGGLMLDTGMFPARHFVSEFPSAEQIERLNAGES